MMRGSTVGSIVCSIVDLRRVAEEIERDIAPLQIIAEALYGFLATLEPETITSYIGYGDDTDKLLGELERRLKRCFDIPETDDMEKRVAYIYAAVEALWLYSLLGEDALPRFARVKNGDG